MAVTATSRPVLLKVRNHFWYTVLRYIGSGKSTENKHLRECIVHIQFKYFIMLLMMMQIIVCFILSFHTYYIMLNNILQWYKCEYVES